MKIIDYSFIKELQYAYYGDFKEIVYNAVPNRDLYLLCRKIAANSRVLNNIQTKFIMRIIDNLDANTL